MTSMNGASTSVVGLCEPGEIGRYAPGRKRKTQLGLKQKRKTQLSPERFCPNTRIKKSVHNLLGKD